MLVIDKRTPANIEYRELSISGLVGTRLVSLLGTSIFAELAHENIQAELEFYLNAWDIPNQAELHQFTGETSDAALELTKFCEGKKRVAVCRDWMNLTIHMADISNVEQTSN
ncbi:hypothetical protein JA33_034 [Dickeya phage vB_DsoM_JA33]|uniref:Uncharacterized protein n=3 Tax=Salmondvirus JA11 TaxID=2734141 RepID=A0A384ZW22_9CAUD|nr:hypothetical protein HOU32_gp034 [Dickeya phage vB_DsoM_JA11]AXG66438.1 hypothetical protein JA13_035 [Dickeya phage vB_DsoM_JA13]AXG67408.1 hypothetical protein JA33_034 [Dickeya phage vB_DsoM_JA33]AYD79839.1 hypothetical protein JA11_034 [Dickeya phage vB_DsoM_JA11]